MTQNGPVTTTISPTANQITATAGGTPRTFTYEAGGELTKDSATGGNFTYSYNNGDRLSEVQSGATEKGAYAYDWRDRQASRQTFGASPAQMTYLRDQDDHLLGQYVSSGSIASNEYIWLDDITVGYVSIASGGSTNLLFVTTGQIDEPLLVTNSTPAVAWSGYTDPFGVAGTIGTPSVQFNLRLPGQLWQSETSTVGLSLNGARNYDPTLGRYTQPDPMGVEGGANLYVYVDGDPLNETDPSGRDCVSNRGFTTCHLPGGPTFTVPTPPGFPKNLRRGGSPFYHAYRLGRPFNCPASAVQNRFAAHPTPGNPSYPATPSGTNNTAQVGPFNNDVTSYTTSDPTTGQQVVVNMTNDGSLLSPGYVAQYTQNGVAYVEGEGYDWEQSDLVMGSSFDDSMDLLVWGPQLQYATGVGKH